MEYAKRKFYIYIFTLNLQHDLIRDVVGIIKYLLLRLEFTKPLLPPSELIGVKELVENGIFYVELTPHGKWSLYNQIDEKIDHLTHATIIKYNNQQVNEIYYLFHIDGKRTVLRIIFRHSDINKARIHAPPSDGYKIKLFPTLLTLSIFPHVYI